MLNKESLLWGNLIMTEKIIQIITDQLSPEKEITLESSIVDDLRADSLDVVEIVMAIEEEFNVNIPDNALVNFKTVGDFVEFIKERA